MKLKRDTVRSMKDMTGCTESTDELVDAVDNGAYRHNTMYHARTNVS